MTITGSNNYINEARRKPPIESAEEWATRSRDAGARLGQLIHHVEALFGHSVAEALRPDIENVTETSGEAIYHFREAVDERQRRFLTLEAERQVAVSALVDAALVIQRRYRSATRKPLPNDLLVVVSRAVELSGYPYLWPPKDYRHTHEHGSGGKCRNPACPHRSGGEVEPF